MPTKPKSDPRLKLVNFVKPNGTALKVNSFEASLSAAVSKGWLPEKEYKAAKAAEAKKK